MTALSYSQAHFSGKIFNRLFFRKTQRVLFTIWIVGSHRMTVAILWHQSRITTTVQYKRKHELLYSSSRLYESLAKSPLCRMRHTLHQVFIRQ